MELRVFVTEKSRSPQKKKTFPTFLLIFLNSSTVEKIYEETNWLIWRNVALYFAIVASLFYAMYRLHRSFGLPVRVCIKDSFGRVEDEENDGKVNDVLLLCSPADSVFTVGVLLPFLHSKTYKCEVCELPANMAICKYQ